MVEIQLVIDILLWILVGLLGF